MVYKPKKKYEWVDTHDYKPNVDANVVGGVFEHLEEEEGGVTRYNFLEFSRPEDSVTHSLFEWNDEVAAEKYRLRQSSSIIHSLRISYINQDREEVKVNAFVNTSAPKEKPKYESIEDALSDLGKREIILNRIKGELDAFIMRNKHIEELADILISAGEKLKEGA